MNVEYIVSLKDKFTPTAKKMNATVAKTDKSVQKLNKTAQRTGLNLKKMLVNGALLYGAFRIAKSSIESWNKQAQAVAQVRQGLISTKNISGKTLNQLKKQASYLQKHSLYGDEDILQGVTAQLLTFTNITGDAFDRTQKVALDLAARLKIDLKSASIQLGKALNDPVKNLSALSRSGIQFTDEQKNMINALWQGGKQAEAQSIILKELERQYGGSAAAAAMAGAGPLKQLQMRLGDLKEHLGGLLFKALNKLMPVFDKVINIVESFFDYLDSHSGTVGKIANAFSGVFNALKSIGSSIMQVFNGLFGAFGKGSGILDGILAISQGINKVLAPILLKLSEGIKTLFVPLTPILRKLFPIFKKIFVDIFVAAKQIFSSFAGKFSGFSTLLMGIARILVKMFVFVENILRTAIIPIIQNVIEILAGVFTQLKPILVKVWDIIKNAYTIAFAIAKVVFSIISVLIRWIKLFMNSGIGKFLVKAILAPIKLIVNLLDKFLKGVAKLAKLAGLDFSIAETKQTPKKSNLISKVATGANTENPIIDTQGNIVGNIAAPAGTPTQSVTTSTGKATGGNVLKITIDKLIETLNITAQNVTESKEQIKRIVVEALTEGLNDVILVTK